MNERKNILVCPLNWGLGHASRCIPIIHILEKNNYTVFLAASGNSYYFLQKVFPRLTLIWFEDYNIKYSKGKNLSLYILWQTPKLLIRIYREHHTLKKLIRKYNIDIIISDNRFGLWNKNVRSVYITHQLHIKTPGENKIMEGVLYRIHQFFINKYDICWIPDFAEGFKLAGALSTEATINIKARYIGILSRFNSEKNKGEQDFDLCVILSGPEPQRTLFENIIMKQLEESDLTAVVILGQPAEDNHSIIDKRIQVHSGLSPAEIQDIVVRSRVILARSGYSTLMDMATLGKKAILIPTPGQTEQEYLSDYVSGQNFFYCATQEHFDLPMALKKVEETTGIFMPADIEQQERLILESINQNCYFD